MRRVFAVVLVFALLPSSVALGIDLDELLERSQEASYRAEQLITCSTPDGSRDTLIELEQRGGEVRYGGKDQADVEVWAGAGGWQARTDDAVIDSAAVTGNQSDLTAGSSYVVSEGVSTLFLGRSATRYVLQSGDLIRAEVVVDDEVGVLMSVTTFDGDGNPYCERRFVSFDATSPDWPLFATDNTEAVVASSTDSSLPDRLGNFNLLDYYSDEMGLGFAYYSDGFFSFAVFESDAEIVLHGGAELMVERGAYTREFTPGQVTYTWPVENGGMALIGDLPPDMHESILEGLPAPFDAGFLRRLWRSLFG